MSVLVTPSPVGSVVAHLRGLSANHNPDYADVAAALAASWPAAVIGSYLTDAAKSTLVPGKGIYGIVAQPTPGVGRSAGALGYYHTEIKVYAPWGHLAERGAILACWLLLPPGMRGIGWDAAGCRVVDVGNVSAPAALVDPIENWPYRSFYCDFRAFEMGFS